MTPIRCDVLGIGENSVDYVYRLPAQLVAGAKMRVTSHRRSLGGQVATTLCACAALGLRAKYVGAFGDDADGERIRGELARRGIDVDDAPVRSGANRSALILVDHDTGERTILWHRDPQLALRAADVTVSLIAGARLVHVDNVDEEAAIAAARIARAEGIPVTSDLDRITGRTPDLVAAVSVPIFAAHALTSLTGDSDPERALQTLRARHDGLLCVTLGAEGALLLAGDRLHRAAPIHVETVDTTGAGDVFRGAFIHALLRGDNPADILRFANAAAAASCTRPGAIDGVPSLEEIERLVNGHDGERRSR